ncbi:proline-rich protein 36-like [Sinocyclocheilus rhinocerous]|uniref:proline-rich protein 36-like n=1 Tax=Sinocyclocheilus rhinocerous TaxID=307959 RepID=UPI0007B8914A|nr:PREDICTED: proline-rich protein 36-like [Sinocyclocheilus rhinocerous]
MESGERLASPSTTPASVHTATSTSSSSSSSSSTAASNVKSSLNHAATASLGTCGPMFGLTGGDQPFNVSSVTSLPSAYPLMAHPAFGLLSPATARPEFGGLGGLGVSAALAAHPQLGAFTEWWRAAEAHGRSSPAFFPPFLGLPPMFAPPLHNHEANPYTSKTPNKSSQASKGVNGAVNGRSLSPSAAKGAVSASASPSPALRIVTPNSGLSKKEKTRLLEAKDFRGGLLGSAPLEPSPPVHLHRSPPPPGLSQPPLLSLSGSRARERPLHTSVIQSTGLAAASHLLSKNRISHYQAPHFLTSAPPTLVMPLPQTTLTPPPLPLSSSPKPPPLTPSLKAQSQASSQKPQSPALDALTSRKILESSLAQVTADYRLKQAGVHIFIFQKSKPAKANYPQFVSVSFKPI